MRISVIGHYFYMKNNIDVMEKSKYKRIDKNMIKLAVTMKELQKQAESLGIFAEMRELLECKNCGLLEDVAYNGHLITYISGNEVKDIGLRFKHITGNIYLCPKCEKKIKLSFKKSKDQQKGT